MKKLLLAVVCCLIFTISSLPACIDVSGTFTFIGNGPPGYFTPPILSQWPVYMYYNQGTPTNPDFVLVQAVNTDASGNYYMTLPSSQVPFPANGNYHVRGDTYPDTFFAGDYSRKAFKFTYGNGCSSNPNEDFVYDFLNY
jgi:hypothetical protein